MSLTCLCGCAVPFVGTVQLARSRADYDFWVSGKVVLSYDIYPYIC